MYVYFFSGHMLLPNVLQMYHEQRLCCRCGVSWKNLANPIVINHLPQFAIELEDQQNPRFHSHVIHPLSFSIIDSTNAKTVSQIKTLFCSWNSCSCVLLLASPISWLKLSSSLSKWNKSWPLVKVTFLFVTPPWFKESSSLTVLNNKRSRKHTLASTLQAVY